MVKRKCTRYSSFVVYSGGFQENTVYDLNEFTKNAKHMSGLVLLVRWSVPSPLKIRKTYAPPTKVWVLLLPKIVPFVLCVKKYVRGFMISF